MVFELRFYATEPILEHSPDKIIPTTFLFPQAKNKMTDHTSILEAIQNLQESLEEQDQQRRLPGTHTHSSSNPSMATHKKI